MYPLIVSNCSEVKYVLEKVIPWKQSIHRIAESVFWARLASFNHLGLISDPLIVSKFHKVPQWKSMIPKDKKIKSTLKWRAGGGSIPRKVPVTSCSEVKGYPLEAKSPPKSGNCRVCKFSGFNHLGIICDPLKVQRRVQAKLNVLRVKPQ